MGAQKPNPKQVRFIEEYAKDRVPRDAARRAGYSARYIRQQIVKLTSAPWVAARMAELDAAAFRASALDATALLDDITEKHKLLGTRVVRAVEEDERPKDIAALSGAYIKLTALAMQHVDVDAMATQKLEANLNVQVGDTEARLRKARTIADGGPVEMRVVDGKAEVA